MPIYQYKCTSPECNHEFEVFGKKVDDRHTHECEKCGTISNMVQTTVEWRTKGKGWYQNLEKDSGRGEFKKRMHKE